MNLKIIKCGKKGAANSVLNSGCCRCSWQWVLSKAKKHSNDAQNKSNLTSRITRLMIKRLKISLKIIIMVHGIGAEQYRFQLEAQVKCQAASKPHASNNASQTMMNMTIMTEIKNVKRWHGQSIVTINCSCTNYRH